jgi:uncharacterized membrane protein YcaP (DUF421 family)
MTLLMGYGRIALSSFCIYLFIVMGIRLAGKKELAQLSVIDLVFILLISNAVQNAMVGPDSTLMGGIVAATTLFTVNYFFKLIIYKFPKVGKLIQGESMLLIYKGVLNHSNMKKAKLTSEELLEAIREHGASTFKEVDLAVLEVDGNISIHSQGFQMKTTRKRKAHKIITRSS